MSACSVGFLTGTLGPRDWIDYAVAFTTIVSLPLVAISTSVGVYQILQDRKARRAAELGRFIRIWNSGELRRARRAAARQGLGQGQFGEAREDSPVAQLLAFFESLGLAVRNRAVSPLAAWENFSEDALFYWHVYADRVERDRHKDPMLWANYARMVEVFQQLEQRRRIPANRFMSHLR